VHSLVPKKKKGMGVFKWNYDNFANQNEINLHKSRKKEVNGSVLETKMVHG
jgi:hypothetical protein